VARKANPAHDRSQSVQDAEQRAVDRAWMRVSFENAIFTELHATTLLQKHQGGIPWSCGLAQRSRGVL